MAHAFIYGIIENMMVVVFLKYENCFPVSFLLLYDVDERKYLILT